MLKLMLIAYLVGQICYWLLKAQAVANSTSNGFPRGWKGVGPYLAHYWVILFIRAISGGAALSIFMGGGIVASADFLPAVEKLNLMVALPFAFFVGLGIDAILEKFQDKITWLKGVIPEAPPPPESNGKCDGAHA